MTLIQSENTGTFAEGHSIWGIINPTSGVHNITVTNTAGAFNYYVTAASYFGTAGTLAAAVPSGSIIHGTSTTIAAWNIASTSDSITVAAGHYALVVNHVENVQASSITCTPTATQTDVFALICMLTGTGTVTEKITPDMSAGAAGIAVDISP
jgi:hypothetical protein